MRYRNISLNGSNYNLVKYEEKYSSCLDKLKKMNKELASCVENAPRVYSELSDHQSYMIFYGEYECIGAINIGTSFDEKNLEIELQINEEFYESKDAISEGLEAIIESLKLFFWDKENIEIRVYNDIDLSEINNTKYQKKVYDENLTTYLCSNRYNNILFSKLFEEIKETERFLMDSGSFWWQQLQTTDLQFPFDEKLEQEIGNCKVALPEIFYKVDTVLWNNISSRNSTRNISFSRNGQVEFVKKSCKKNGINYEFNYNVLADGFNLNACLNEKKIEIADNIYFTRINMGALNILYSKDNKRKKITYITPILNNSSIALELWTDENDKIERCYVDFRIHKNNGKIKGFYALRIAPKHYYDKFSIRFISRKGDRYYDFSELVAEADAELFSNIMDGEITIELLNNLLKIIIPVINSQANFYGANLISGENVVNMQDLMETQVQIINFIKQIKDEIPMPYLSEILGNFIAANDKSNKTKVNKRILKKDAVNN